MGAFERMTMKPRIFISAVSHELESTRNIVADEVRKLACEAVLKNTFGTKAGRVRNVLREEIDTCDGLIHIVGQAYGEEPHEVDPDMGRVSYTQYELCYAQKWGKPCWIIILGDEYPTGKNLDALDLPSDLSAGEARGDQAERRDLQARWRARLSARQQEAMTYRVRNEAELRLAVKEIKNHDAELREKEARRQEENEKRQKENLRWSVTGVLIGVPILLGVGLACWMLTMYQADQQVESRLARFDREDRKSEMEKMPERTATAVEDRLWNVQPDGIKILHMKLIDAEFDKEMKDAEGVVDWKMCEEA